MSTVTDILRDNPLVRVLEDMRDGAIVCNAEAQVILVNRAFRDMWGLQDRQLPCDLSELLPSEELPAYFRTLLHTRISFDCEVALPSGSASRIFQVHAMPLGALGAAEVPGGALLFYDQTAIRKTEKMRRDFVANVSHELRTPLSAIRGYAETLLDGALEEDPTVAVDFVKVIYKHSNRLTQLVEDLLDLSKMESSDFQPDMEPIVLMPLVRHLQTLEESSLRAKHLQLSLDIPDDLPPVLANASNLEQVLMNLIDNAIKYTPEGGQIGVSAHMSLLDSRLIQINVSDTGIGIEPKHIARLFERFYRVDKARSRDMGGTGLGLSIVKHIVQLHGGEIWVESEVGHGTTFSFTLQRATLAESAEKNA